MNSIYEILDAVQKQNTSKLSDRFLTVFLKAIMAGMFIGIGGSVAIRVMTRFPLNDGFRGPAGAFVFSIGFILIITLGAQLFTGNSLMALNVLDNNTKLKSVLNNWTIVWIGNLIGTLFMAALIYYSNGLNAVDLDFVTNLVSHKVGLSFMSAILLGIGCNIVIVLTVLMGTASKDYLAKVVVSVFGVMVFFLSGYEHIIANMYFVSLSVLNGTHSVIDIVVSNLFPVTIGNLIGGAVIIPLLLHYTYKK